jgi:sarcosine oxidase
LKQFDAIVVGCGIYGSSISYFLASEGVKILTLESFQLNHPFGSSHGMTRIIRTAYAEDPLYVPLVRKAKELWFELQNQSGSEIIRMTGGLHVGWPESYVIRGAQASARKHGIDYKLLEAKEVETQFPAFHPSPDQVGILEKEAGILFAENCVKAYVNLASESGAEFQFHEPLVKWKVRKAERVTVSTGKEEYEADSIIFASGGWLGKLLEDLRLPLSIERQVVFWMSPKTKTDLLSSNNMPIFIFEENKESQTNDIFYGTPDVGAGLKVGKHHGGTIVRDPKDVKREIATEDERPIRNFLECHIPIANGSMVSSTTCIYTNTPDGNFLIDHHPKHENVKLVSACSGHGFKFAPVIGNIVAEDYLGKKSEFDLSPFKLSRFQNNSHPPPFG